MIAYVTRRAATQEDLDAFGTAKLARDIERGRAVVLAAVNVSLGVDEDGDALGVPQPAGRVQRRLAGASVATIEARGGSGEVRDARRVAILTRHKERLPHTREALASRLSIG